MSATDEVTEAGAVADLALKGAEPKQLAPGTVYAIPDASGGVRFKDTDEYADAPRRAVSSRTVTDAASFVAYLAKHGLPQSEVWADSRASSVVARIDAHQGAGLPAGWEGHKLSLSLEKTLPWLAWEERDLGSDPHNWFSQVEFAEFIEARALDVVEPDHARLIEIATTFEAKKSADFGSSTRLDNGDVKFNYTEMVAAKAGQKGSLEIPKTLQLALRPYTGGPIYHVFAQFRYRLNGGDLKLGFALERPQDILDAAFVDIVTEIRDGKTFKDSATGVETRVHEGIGDIPIFYGRP